MEQLASHNAGVMVVIVGLTNQNVPVKKIYSLDEENKIIKKIVKNINPYLIEGIDIFISPSSIQKNDELGCMQKGNQATDGGHLLLDYEEVKKLNLSDELKKSL